MDKIIGINRKTKNELSLYKQDVLMSNFLSAITRIRRIIEYETFNIYKVIGGIEENNVKFSSITEFLLKKANGQLENDLWEEIKDIYSWTSKYIHFYNEESITQEEFEDKITSNSETLSKLLYLSHKRNGGVNDDFSEFTTDDYEVIDYFTFNDKNNFKILSFEDIINDYQIIIPLYQRRFVWGNELILNFIKNTEVMSSIHVTLDPQDKRSLNIIDGQQRLRTIFAFFYFLKEKDMLSSEEENLINRLDLSFIKEIYGWPKNLIKLFEENISDPVKMKKSLLNKYFMIHFTDWEKQVNTFFSLNYNSKALTTSELALSWLLDGLNLNKQKEIMKKLNNFAGKIKFGIRYKEIEHYNNFEEMMNQYVNLEAIIKLFNYKEIKYDLNEKIKEGQRRRFFDDLNELSSFLIAFDNKKIWNEIHRFISLDPELKHKDPEYFTGKWTQNFSKHLSKKNFSEFNKVLTLIKVSLWSHLGSSIIHTENKEQINWSFDSVNLNILAFIYSLVDFDEELKLKPNKYYLNNKESINRFIREYVVSIDNLQMLFKNRLNIYGIDQALSQRLESMVENWDFAVLEIMNMISKKEISKVELNEKLDYFDEILKKDINIEKGISNDYIHTRLYEANAKARKDFETKKIMNAISFLKDEELYLEFAGFDEAKHNYSMIIIEIGKSVVLIEYIIHNKQREGTSIHVNPSLNFYLDKEVKELIGLNKSKKKLFENFEEYVDFTKNNIHDKVYSKILNYYNNLLEF